MKVRILSFTAGEGHNQVARALQEYYEQQGDDVAVIDVIGSASKIIKNLVNDIYNFTVNYAPRIYKYWYEMEDKKTYESDAVTIRKMTQSLITSDEIKSLVQEKPDVIIATQSYAAAILRDLKVKYKMDAICVGIVTDFTVHPYWEEAGGLDYYVVPDKAVAFNMARKNLDVSRMLPFGIPIREVFSESVSKEEAREKLGYDPQKKRVLLMSGSMAHVNVVDVAQSIDKLPQDFELTVLLDKKQTHREELLALDTKHKMDIQGFVSDIGLYYDASDLVITKPGGLTTSELMAKEKPMIFLRPIPGQEQRNVECLMNQHLAFHATRTFPIEQLLGMLLDDPSLYESTSERIKRRVPKHSTKRLVEFLQEKHEQRKGMQQI